MNTKVFDVIIEWYTKNINAIHSNEFCFEDDEHDRIFEIMKKIKPYEQISLSGLIFYIDNILFLSNFNKIVFS